MEKIVLAGGSGFIGNYLEEKFKELGYDVKIISRKTGHVPWDNQQKLREAIDGSCLLINLAGKSVNCRYNRKNREEIMQSRLHTTAVLGETLLACSNPPGLWINSSTATIYRHAEDRPMTEANGEFGSGFSVDVAKGWEEAFFSFSLPQTRQVALRIAIVLGRNGGVMTPYKNLVKFGLGGRQGSGKQMFSWIHVDDLYRIIRFIQSRSDLEGVFNCSSPNPVSNTEMMALLRNRMNRNVGLPAPKWMLETGSVIIRTETELVLKSRWVLPERLQKEGYRFRFDTLDKTFQDILQAR